MQEVTAHTVSLNVTNNAACDKACFLNEPGKKTPLTVRFSTVQGPRGSYDTARDLRCKGVKFYTEEGNYDLTTVAIAGFDQSRSNEVP